MPTYLSPVSVTDFQAYINDTSLDPDILNFYKTLLDRATERIYRYLDLDFTAEAPKTESFWGNGANYHRLHQPAGIITSWEAIDLTGSSIVMDTSKLVLYENGKYIHLKEGFFDRNLEHRIGYELPESLSAPETVQQVIIEVAATMLRESNKGAGALGESSESTRENDSSISQQFYELEDRHRQLLSAYRRYAL